LSDQEYGILKNCYNLKNKAPRIKDAWTEAKSSNTPRPKGRGFNTNDFAHSYPVFKNIGHSARENKIERD